MEEFNPTLCQCTECETILQSKWEGQFVRCECGKSFVDQTRYCSRYGGSVLPVEFLLKRDFIAFCLHDEIYSTDT